MHIKNEPRTYESGVDGPAPAIWYGESAPNGDSKPFSTVPVGSIYVQTGDNPQVWHKSAESTTPHDSDWSVGMAVLSQRVSYTDFTDGGAAVGTLDLDRSIPAGAYVLRTVIHNVTGFAGNVSAALTVGDGTTVDRYNTSTLDVFSTVAAIDGGAVSGTALHTAAKTPKLTITVNSDWGLVSAGALTVKIFYLI